MIVSRAAENQTTMGGRINQFDTIPSTFNLVSNSFDTILSAFVIDF